MTSTIVAHKNGHGVPLANGLSLVPVHTIALQFFRKEVSPPIIDEWQLKEMITDILKRQVGFTLDNPRLLKVRKLPDPQKLRKEDALATGEITILGSDGLDASGTSKKVQENLNGAQLRIGMMKLVCEARLVLGVTFESLQDSWQHQFGVDEDAYEREDPGKRPDTLHLSGIPPRWLADRSMSSDPSIQVANLLFSVLGAVRKVEITGSTNIEKLVRNVSSSGDADLASQLTCQVYVQFQTFQDFKNAASELSGKVLLKEGSSLVGAYSLAVECNDYFSEKNVRGRKFERMRLDEEDRRRAMIRQRKAELARLDKERQEAEERERILRLQEEKLRAEEEEARRIEEERVHQEMLRQEEERLRLEEEARIFELRRREEEARKKAEDDRRMRAELAARLEKEKVRIVEEADRKQREQRDREQTLRRRLQETRERDREREMEERYRESDTRRKRSRREHVDGEDAERESGHDRWRMDLTHSLWQEESLRMLSAPEASRNEQNESDADVQGYNEDGDGADLSRYLRRKVRSVAVIVDT